MKVIRGDVESFDTLMDQKKQPKAQNLYGRAKSIKILDNMADQDEVNGLPLDAKASYPITPLLSLRQKTLRRQENESVELLKPSPNTLWN